MAAPLKLGITVAMDASGVTAGAQATRQAIAGIGTEAVTSATKLQKLVDAELGLARPAANSNSRAADIAAYGAELDRLRAKFNPLYAVTATYKTAVAEIRQAHRLGAISADEMTAAISRQRQATLASIDAIKGRNAAIRAGQGGGGANTSFAATNTMYQFQDIATTAAMGMSPAMIGLQQGSQIAGAYAGLSLKDAAKTTASALTSLLSPTSIAAIALTAGAAAAIQFGMGLSQSSSDAKKLEEVLGSHAETVERLKKQYGDLGSAIKSAMPIGGAGFTDASARNEIATLETAIKKQSEDLATSFGGFLKGGLLGSSTAGLDALLSTDASPFQKQVNDLLTSVRAGKGDLSTFQTEIESAFDALRQSSDAPAKLNAEMERLTAAAQDAFSVSPKFEPFQAEIAKLTLGLKNGNADLSDFATNVSRIGQLNGLQKVADEVILASKGAVELAETLREVRAIIQQMDREDTRSGLSAQRETARYVNLRAAALQDANAKFAADQQLILAQTNAEKLAAIEARVRASAREDGDKDGGLQARIDRELTAERNRQAVEARNATLARTESIQQTIAQQRLELSLIGQTTAAREEQLFAEQQISTIRQEAARTGAAIDEQEISRIRQKAAEYGRLKAEIEAANYLQSQTANLDRLRYQTAIATQPVSQQSALLAQYDAEVKIRELGADPTSDRAEAIRRVARETAAWNTQLARTTEAWNAVQQSAGNTIDSIVDGLSSGNIKDALKTIVSDINKTFLELAIKNPIKNALLGTSSGTLSDVGGIGGIFSRLFGGGSSSATSLASKALGQSVGTMQVAAGTVMLNGGVTGGLTTLLGGTQTAANSNSSLLDLSSYRKAISSIESGGNYSALGPLTASGDRAYGAYQVMGANIPSWTKATLGTSMTPNEFLASSEAQDAVFNKYFGASVAKYGNAQDAASVWFSGRPLSSAANASDALGTTSTAYVDKFNSALGNVTGSTNSAASGLSGLNSATGVAAKGLDGLGSGLGKFGQILAQAQASGNGGLVSLLGSLTSYGQSVFNSSSQFQSAILNGGIGLYSSGGYTGDGGLYEPAGVVHKGEIVWSQADIARAGGMHTVEAMRLGKRGYADGGVVDSYPTPKRLWSPANGNDGSGKSLSMPRSATITLNMAGAYGKDEMRAEAYAGMQAALDEYDRAMPDRMQEISAHPRWR
ncbi:hypothetical protein QO005_000985 [Rhizobium paknamense]|uniref:Bacteriophage tail tape measure N-terminal domain-containing protein n=2 Tax=Rhizobium paknamense TaxID=1206817 RepID=A0ABU0IAI4_9HYPH|nr:hypothetical protein [Rhizobium paknamense]